MWKLERGMERLYEISWAHHWMGHGTDSRSVVVVVVAQAGLGSYPVPACIASFTVPDGRGLDVELSALFLPNNEGGGGPCP